MSFSVADFFKTTKARGIVPGMISIVAILVTFVLALGRFEGIGQNYFAVLVWVPILAGAYVLRNFAKVNEATMNQDISKFDPISQAKFVEIIGQKTLVTTPSQRSIQMVQLGHNSRPDDPLT